MEFSVGTTGLEHDGPLVKLGIAKSGPVLYHVKDLRASRQHLVAEAPEKEQEMKPSGRYFDVVVFTSDGMPAPWGPQHLIMVLDLDFMPAFVPSREGNGGRLGCDDHIPWQGWFFMS